MAYPSALANAVDQLRTWRMLRQVTEVGQNAVVTGSPLVQNRGNLTIGNNFRLTSRPAQSHVIVERGGRLVVGDNVKISFGAAIHCQLRISIGNDCEIGPFAVIADSDFHVAGQRNAHAVPTPIQILDGVKIGSRVTIMRGTTIGVGATVQSGSVVSGQVEAGATIGGVPARSITENLSAGSMDLAELVMRVLGLEALPGLGDGPEQIPEWDSLGSLKLLLALEEAYQVTVREDAMRAVNSIGSLAAMLEQSARA